MTAGLGGFFVLFGLALAIWFLGRDLNRRLRRMRQQEMLAEREQAAAEQHDEHGEEHGEGQASEQSHTAEPPEADAPPRG